MLCTATEVNRDHVEPCWVYVRDLLWYCKRCKHVSKRVFKSEIPVRNTCFFLSFRFLSVRYLSTESVVSATRTMCCDAYLDYSPTARIAAKRYYKCSSSLSSTLNEMLENFKASYLPKRPSVSCSLINWVYSVSQSLMTLATTFTTTTNSTS
jgi:hypothetical protein